MTREKIKLILLAISLALFLGGLILTAIYYAPTIGKTVVTCTVIKAEHRSRISAGTKYTPSERVSASAVEISYKVVGKEYTRSLKLDYYAPVNTTMTGYVNPSKPEELVIERGAGSIMNIVVFFVTGILLLIVRSRLPGFYR
jgi:hypothetical protein